MKKITTLLLTAILAISSASAQHVLFEYTFNDSNKEGLTFYDVDQLTPTSFMQSIGFAVGTPWVLIRDSNTSKDLFISSTSQYLPAGQANDWMVLPEVNVVNENFTLEWKSQAYEANKRDGLKVFISTKGNKPENFPAEPVWEVAEEEIGATSDFEGEFITHELSLAPYVGQAIYIAFVNQSYDKSLLAIDDIKVYSNDKFAIELNLGRVINEVEEIEFSGRFINNQLDNLDEVTVTLEYGETSVTETFANLNLALGESTPFVMQHKMPIKFNETINYSLHATAGDNTFTYISSVTNNFRRRVVIEEHTGVRCSFCPLGTWAIDSIKEIEPDKIAPIAVQCAQLGALDLLVTDYTGGLYSNGITEYPEAWIDRTYASTPTGNAQGYNFDDENSWISLFYKQLNEIPEAGVTVTATLSEDKKNILAEAQVRTAEDKTNLDWRVIYVLTEDHVTGYYQSNSYSGNKSWVGGWESKPQSVEVVLHDVARGIYPNFYGLEGSLPTTMTAGQMEKYSYTIEIPYTQTMNDKTYDFVQNVSNLNVIAMVVDGKTKRVINADLVHLKDLAGINDITNDATRSQLVVENGTVKVNNNADMTATLITVDGRILATTTGRGQVTLNAAGYHGVAIVQIVANGTVEVQKTIVR